MELKTKILGIESGGKPFVFLNVSDADELGVSASGRLRIKSDRELTVIVNISSVSVQKGYLGISDEVQKFLKLEQDSIVDVQMSPFPKSLQFIRNKLNGKKLTDREIHEIVNGVVNGNLNESEISAFVTSLHIQGLSLDEATSLSSSMVLTGKQLFLNVPQIVDKHSIGGVPGDKTTLLVVPIIAASGLIIPKTSSRAITSAAGTADRAETLMPVNLEISEMKKVIQKTNGCIVWGGALDLAPADDIFVKTEYSLCIDPLLLPSIMSKKKAVGATHLIVDIPTGRGAKMKTIGEADLLAKDIIELGKRLGMHCHCVLTYGEQPIGNTIGPSLEAREALNVLMNKSQIPDLFDKVCHVAGSVFEITGKKNGFELAQDILLSGKAEKKLREIISYQGGQSEIKPDDFVIGTNTFEYTSVNDGQVLWMDNNIMVEIARAAGAPKNKGSGIMFNKKNGDKVTKNDLLFTVYSEKSQKLSRVEQILDEKIPMGIGDKMEMLIHQVKEPPVVRRSFVLDR
ncbi:AMP phosphorylase [Nitrosopumilus sp. b3]|uniref:AMP phosphorylase n=1 Tax=Nitrosopumilus sp. b3 TaxID=2109909 RepID=UPI0015F5439E|nr:AMP phosphorylase [Nitrosopumilus sp. b3]KAF6246249.1 AMP phosphorylase [Nitrosopumilus sp. b3]